MGLSASMVSGTHRMSSAKRSDRVLEAPRYVGAAVKGFLPYHAVKSTLDEGQLLLER